MREAGLHDEIYVAVGVKPIEERIHLLVDARSDRRLKVDALLANRTGDDLHWPATIITPASYPDFAHAAAPRGEKRRVPGKQPFGRERLVVVTCGIEHHLNHAFHVPVGGFETSCIHPES